MSVCADLCTKQRSPCHLHPSNISEIEDTQAKAVVSSISAFARRHEGTSLKAYAVDPGAAKTELQRSANYVHARHLF